MDFHPIVISGGRGTRLWPYSRTFLPKPFCDFFNESLMAKTLNRLRKMGQPGVITIQAQKVLTDRTFNSLGLTPSLSLYEPFGKNTAASVAWVTKEVLEKAGPEAIVGIFPADQLIAHEDRLIEAVAAAKEAAKLGQIVTLGVKPTSPATGFGYIEVKNVLSNKASDAIRFREKPDLKTATQYLTNGNFFWNAGIFIFRTGVMKSLFQTFASDIWDAISTIKSDRSNLGEVYASVRSTSVDYAIMEQLENNFLCVPCDIGWSDVGSWEELSKLKELKKHDKTYLESSERVTALSHDKSKVIGVVGLKDVVIVDTKDALLITDSKETQKVTQLVTLMEREKEKAVNEHVFDVRPWGKYEVLEDNESFKLKKISVEPNKQLSYQSHSKRAEHWIIVKGEATVILNDKEMTLKSGEYIYIPQGAKHRIRNASRDVVELIEVQTGSYFGEDDIVRHSDDFGRA